VSASAARAANIGAAGRRRRLLLGAAALGLGVVALAVLLVADVDRGWRLALLAPFWVGALGVLQARGLT
jgi:hypothetical protein